MPYTVQLTVVGRKPLRHAVSTLLTHKIPFSDTMILLARIYMSLENISEIQLLPALTAQNKLSSDLQELNLHYRLSGREFMKLDKNLVGRDDSLSSALNGQF
jgi:hypothetical protein